MRHVIMTNFIPLVMAAAQPALGRGYCGKSAVNLFRTDKGGAVLEVIEKARSFVSVWQSKTSVASRLRSDHVGHRRFAAHASSDASLKSTFVYRR